MKGIINCVQSQKAGMLIIGTHGEQTMGKIALGSVAEQVLRLAPCLVLVEYRNPWP